MDATVEPRFAALRARIARGRAWLPEGRALPDEIWIKRHNSIRLLLVIQAVGLAVFGIVRGRPILHAIGESSLIAVAAWLAGRERFGRTPRAVIACYGLLISSALLVHFAGGSIEAHFHFFVMISVIALYQEWVTYLLALGFVVIHHGLMGALAPQGVYNHSAAVAHPWTWALIHGVMVLGAASANTVLWRANESQRRQVEDLLDDAIKKDADLTRALSLLSATLESTEDGILAVSRDGITSFNQRFADISSIPEEVLASGDIDRTLKLFAEQTEDPGHFIQGVLRLQEDPDTEAFDEIHFKDGRTVERTSRPLVVDAVTVGRVLSFRDVTQRRRLDELKDSLLSAVSHEIRTPLTTIVGYGITLEKLGKRLSKNELEEIYGRISTNASKLQRLVNDMLDVDRLSRGLITPNVECVDLGKLLGDITEEASDLTGRLVQSEIEPVSMVADAPKVERMVENLIINATRHTPPHVAVWVRLHPCDDGVLISVDDAGPGVPDEMKIEIFKPFSQGQSLQTHSPGVGIGLSLVARFAELHGGRAWVEDRPGGGASFKVFLPGEPEIAETSAA